MEPLSPPEHLRDVGQEFESKGILWRGLLEDFGLRPEHRVLDPGCGVGRIAIPLTSYITTGSYEGFDISRPMLEWCHENITPRFPNFRFQWADVYNKRYNPEGRQKASEYRFPYDDASFDFLYLTSVFTHMMPKDIDRYMSEIKRVLKPGARCVITYFLLNDVSLAAIATGTTRPAFKHRKRGYRLESKKIPEAAIAYDESAVRETYARHGVTIELVEYGEWARAEGRTRQDIIVARR